MAYTKLPGNVNHCCLSWSWDFFVKLTKLCYVEKKVSQKMGNVNLPSAGGLFCKKLVGLRRHSNSLNLIVVCLLRQKEKEKKRFL